MTNETVRTGEITSRLMRLLHGELAETEAVALREQLRLDGELANRYRELEELWTGLDLPEPQPAPPGYAQRVSLAAQVLREERVSWSMAPRWAQAAAAFALAGGIALGLGLAGVVEVSVDVAAVDSDPTLTESYWQILDEIGEDLVLETLLPEPVSEGPTP